MIAFVFAVITFSKSDIGGNAKLVSMWEVMGITFTPAATAKPFYANYNG